MVTGVKTEVNEKLENQTEPIDEEKETTEVEEVEDGAEGEKEGEAKPITFATQEELDQHVEKKARSLANSIADKSSSKYQQKIRELTTELNKVKDGKEDNAVEKLLASLKSQGEDEEQVMHFDRAIREVVDRERKLRDRETEWNDKHEKATQSARDVNAFTEALSLLLPEDDSGFVSNLSALSKRISSAETEKEKALVIELERAKLERLVEGTPKENRKPKPDTHLGTVPGGVDFDKMSPDEKIRYGLAHPKKK